MALSDYERKMLEELEAQLADEDPSFAQNMKPKEVRETVTRQLSIRHLVLGLLALVCGIALLVWGVAASMLWISGGGVIIMFGGVWYALAGITTQKIEQPVGADSNTESPGAKARGFMARQVEEWNRRRRDFGGA
ncbi:Protein of uncharacterised function (DUF3040) [Actinobaculum suis]|uniref:Protein of uncharacterized function (DUF3040) n=1 Tax=Actinobaculum suis TaxID=1657 RepID=A0A7Z8YAJ4_9ACTO|nr:DUF3040 domain-containing protein [Actinobaculum suis]VDG76754.1 Protein of uncharacterised function (DUF3040) [Actinobaculum suis]